MSIRRQRAGRRTWVYLAPQTSCVIWGQQRPFGRWAQWDVTHRAFAYEMTCVLKLPTERVRPAEAAAVRLAAVPELHVRWAEHRTVGEWFAADPVLADLRQQMTGRAVAA